jgi:serine phosphatase RsbU (regulator of sigma subunit)/anti-sigma regulatory factor (Ser/Thr protein kinase)
MQRPEALERSGSGDQWLVEADGPQLRAMLGTLLHAAPLGIGLWDAELRFVFVNDALAEMNGLPAADHIGRTVVEVVPGVAEDGLAALRHVLETGEPLLDLEIVGETPAQPGVERSWSESLYRVQLDAEQVGVAAIVLETTAQRHAEALRGAATRRLVALSDYANTLALADTAAAVAEAVLAHVPAALDADFVTLALLDDAERAITFVHPTSLDPEVAERYTSMPLDVPSPLTDAVRTGEIVVVPSFEENAERYPDLIDDTRSSGLVAVAAAPLCIEDGAIGAIGFGWRRRLPEDDVTEARLVVIADLTAQTFERTRAADLRAGLIDELQRHLVPDQPERPGLEIAVRYQAAGSSIGFGGDWYDIVALDEGTTAVVVGDVAGHGIAAAARMAVLRTSLNTVIRLGTPLEDIFDTTEPLVEHLDTAFLGTALIAVVRPADGTLSHSSAGHPPLLVKAPGRPARTLEGASRPVLGAGLRRPAATTEALPPGSLVVAYTDGLVEGRREHLDTAIDRLLAVIDAAPSTATCEELADLLLESAGSSDDLTDDLVVVVLRVQGPDPTDEPDQVTATFPPELDSVTQARHWAVDLCRSWGLGELGDPLGLVVDELVANAVIHAATDVEVTLRREGAAIRGTVRDGGRGQVEAQPVDLGRIGGWGLHLVGGLTRSWDVAYDDTGKAVTFEIAPGADDA